MAGLVPAIHDQEPARQGRLSFSLTKDRLLPVHFRLRYVAPDVHLGGNTFTLNEPKTGVTLSITERPKEDTGYTANEAICEAVCSRELSSRLDEEVRRTGVLSVTKQAIRAANSDMHALVNSTLRVIRWRQATPGHHRPIRNFVSFDWSVDGETWMPVSDTVHVSMDAITWFYPWSAKLAFSVEELVRMDEIEPLGHELYHEAEELARSNPRSAIVVAVAAAEIGFKQFVAKLAPHCEWLLMHVPSPPLTEMLTDFLPTLPVRNLFRGQPPSIPTLIIGALKKAMTVRNQLVHGRATDVSTDTVLSILPLLRDFLYLLDFYLKQDWAIENVSINTRKELASSQVLDK
jgi:hypothetical protein